MAMFSVAGMLVFQNYTGFVLFCFALTKCDFLAKHFDCTKQNKKLVCEKSMVWKSGCNVTVFQRRV